MRKFFKKIQRHSVFIVIFTILFMIAFGGLVFFFAPERYEARVTLMINSQTKPISNENYELDSKLLEDYRAICKSDRVLTQARKKANLDDIPLEKLRLRIQVSEVKGTNLITITTHAQSGEKAASFANAVAKALQKEVLQLYDLDNVQIIDEAKITTMPVRMSWQRMLLIGLAGGFIVAIIIALLIDYFDDTIRTIDQAVEIFEKPVLGQIPHGITRLRKR